MKKFISVLAFASVAMIGAEYQVDASHSYVGFETKHMSVSKVKGNFGKFSGVVEVDGKTIKALNGEVEINSINTNDNKRDKHLNENDFFDSKKFPKATLKLIKHNGKKLDAELTIKDVTKKVTFSVALSGPIKSQMNGKDLIAVSLNGNINRKDFNIGKDTPDVMLSDNIDIIIEIEAAAK